LPPSCPLSLRSEAGIRSRARDGRGDEAGSYRLILVVMADAGAAFGGQLDITASVEHRLFGLMSCRARPVGSEPAVCSSG